MGQPSRRKLQASVDGRPSLAAQPRNAYLASVQAGSARIGGAHAASGVAAGSMVSSASLALCKASSTRTYIVEEKTLTVRNTEIATNNNNGRATSSGLCKGVLSNFVVWSSGQRPF